MPPSLWMLTSWFSDRTRANRSASRARRGRCSQTSRPGRLVGIGRNSPRIPDGAAGFMSNVSWWLAPPNWWRKITDRARPGAAPRLASARSTSGNPSPSPPTAPTRSSCRRVARDRRKSGQPMSWRMVVAPAAEDRLNRL